jgi:hypothetical protein
MVKDVLLIAERLASIDVESVLISILNEQKTQDFITDLNTQVQLYGQGINYEGKKLASIGGGYKPSTIKIKARKGQPTNRVTLYDTGEFYDSFDVKVDNNANYTITADPDKNGVSLYDRWGDKVAGLTKENEAKVLEYLENEFYKRVLR